MPRDRSRGRPARPDDTAPADDGADDADDDDDPTPDLSERDGTIDDLLDDQVGDVEQQVLSGSQANLRIAPEVNPGFVETEVVNRMGLVLSLNLEFDPSRQQWVPAVVDKTERQAVEQTLTEDRATDNLSGVVDTDDNTVTDGNGDLKLDDGGGTDNYNPGSRDGSGSGYNRGGITVIPDGPTERITATFRTDEGTVGFWEVIDDDTGQQVATADGGDGQRRFFASFDSGTKYRIQAPSNEEDVIVPYWGPYSYPIAIPGGNIQGGANIGNTGNDVIYFVEDISLNPPAESGEATSSFDNPCTASSTRSVQHDVCSKSSDVTVDLYNGDPDRADSTLLARDIDQREDITDLPDSFTDLQYKITLNRDENGDSPKIGRLGHQLIR